MTASRACPSVPDERADECAKLGSRLPSVALLGRGRAGRRPPRGLSEWPEPAPRKPGTPRPRPAPGGRAPSHPSPEPRVSLRGDGVLRTLGALPVSTAPLTQLHVDPRMPVS